MRRRAKRIHPIGERTPGARALEGVRKRLVAATQHRVMVHERLDEARQALAAHRDRLRCQEEELSAAHQAISTLHARYVDLADFAPVGYAVLTSTGVIEALNLTAAELLGVDRRYLPRVPFSVFVAKEDRRTFYNHMARCRGTEGTIETDLTLKRRSGDTVTVQLTSKPAHPSGRSVSYHTAIVDLTERRRAEAARAQAEEERRRLERERQAARAADEAKNQFLAVLSHELRTPLTPIVLAIGALEVQGDVPEVLRARLEMIKRNVLHEARLIDDLLDVTRIARGKLELRSETLDLHALLNDVVARCAEANRRAGLEVSITLDARRHHVHADPTRLRQVFWNLIENARSCTPRGGRVSIESADCDGRRVSVRVTDTGRGIDPASLSRIFSPFEQERSPERPRTGLGLGLAICHGLVEAHQGRITAASDGPGRGAIFTVELPAVAPRAESPRADPRATLPRPLAILLVEDDSDTGSALMEVLRLHGHAVERATGVREALAFPVDHFDVVLADIGLPDGTGFELMRELRARHPIPGIALSGYGAPNDLRESQEAGFACHLVKPVDPTLLVEQIEKVAGGAYPHPGPGRKSG